jgi:predicted PurR-regulated permease PerM
MVNHSSVSSRLPADLAASNSAEPSAENKESRSRVRRLGDIDLDPDGDSTVVENADGTWSDIRTWTVGNVAMATLLAVLVGLGFLLLYQFYMIVLIFFIGLSLSIAIKPATTYLQRYNVPPRVSIVLIYVVLALFLGLLLWLIIPLISSQVLTVVERLPTYYNTLRDYLVNSPSSVIQSLGSLLPLHFAFASQMLMGEGDAAESAWLLWQWLSNTANGMLILIVVLLLAYHWTLEGDNLLQRFLLRLPQERRETVRSLVEEVQERIGGYVRGQTILCVIIGLASVAAFWLIGVPNALTLGLIMGVLEAVPVIGPLLGAVPAILLTLSTAPEKTIWVVVALAAIQQLENSFLVPRVMDESVGVNAIVSILAISAFGLLFGIVGAILAIPLAAMLQILLNRLIFAKANEAALEPAETVQPSRDRLGVLRFEAQELAQDVRKQARNSQDVDEASRTEEEANDRIELLALELDTLLAEMEQSA